MKEFAIFWGCTIPARFPFLEKSTRLVLEAFKLPYTDVDGFTCCPEKSLVNNIDPGLWRLTAASNVALADEKGVDVVSPCTGCISNLSTVKTELNTNATERAEANAILNKAGRDFKGKAELTHLVPFFHDKVGPRKIKELMKRDFAGMKFALHYGCHMVRPSHSLKIDDPMKPKKFDLLIKALGGSSLDYRTKMQCCGQGLDRVNQHDNALHLARIKLRELRMAGADAMVLCCPSCFLQFDNNQFLMAKSGEKYNIPIIYFTELIGLALGFTPKELCMDAHRVDVTPFLEKWEARNAAACDAKESIDATGVFGL